MKDLMLLFDLDGTLWDSAKEVAESWNIVLQKYSHDTPVLTADDIHAVMGKTMDEISQIILTDMEGPDRKALFKECEEYEVEYVAQHGGTLFPGIVETLKKLKAEGYRMVIVSNCQSGYIDAFLQSMHMSEFFCDKEEWGNTKRSKAENIRLVMERNHAAEGVYIGDTDKDQEAAKGAGIPFIHAAYGFGGKLEADAVIETFEELPEVLRNFRKY